MKSGYFSFITFVLNISINFLYSMEIENLEAYNKTNNHQKHGTLIGNWHEEAKLKEETGNSRLSYPKHKGKSHKELFDETKITTTSSKTTTDSLSTSQRIFGGDNSVRFAPTNAEYGKSSNPAEKLPQVRRKHLLLQKQVDPVHLSNFRSSKQSFKT